jgi:hypothetical protein
VQRSPTDCGASFCVIKKPRGRGGHIPRWAAEPKKYGFMVSDDDYDVNTTKMFLRVLHPCLARRACGCSVVSCKLSDLASELASRFALL